MKRYLYLLPLMVFALAGLSACDDKKEEQAQGTETSISAPAAEESAPAVEEEAVALSAPTVSEVLSYATAEGVANGAVFFSVTNPNMADDVLLSAKADVSETVELHETYTDEATGVSGMRSVVSIPVKAQETVVLSPKGVHIMLMGLKAPLAAGSTFDLTLTFEKAGELVVPVTVSAPMADASPAPAPAEEAAPMEEVPAADAPAPASQEAPAGEAGATE